MGTYILRCIFFISFIYSTDSISAQYNKTATCKDGNFDNKVNGMLSYTAPVISVTDAYKNKNKYLFLDAREISEYEISHIAQAKFIGYDDFDVSSMKNVPKDQDIIVYCSIGYRSEKIATKLKKMGYKKVFNLYGSLFEWANRGYPLSDKQGKPTKKIHTYNQEWSQWVLANDVEKVW